MSRWTFEPILESYWMVAFLATILILLLIFIRPSTISLVARRKTWLLILRACLIGLLVIAMLRPARVSVSSEPQSATLLILFDESRSMDIEDSAQGRSRWQELVTTMNSAAEPLSRLGDELEVRAYRFSNGINSVDIESGQVQMPATPTGKETDIGAALEEMLQRETGKRLAGVILMSDGAQRVYEPKVDMQQVARTLARMDCPLYTIGFGKPREQSQSRDVAIENLRDQYAVFVKNELAIQGALRVQGFVNRPLPVRIEVLKPDGQTETLGPIDVTAVEDDSLVPFEFVFSPQEPGDYKLTVKADPQDGELVVDNNQTIAFLTALDGGLQVLFLEGNLLGFEQKMIRRSLATSPDIQLDFRPIDPRLRDSWPIDLSDVLQEKSYDVFLIGDVDAAALGPENLSFIAEQVEQGKGLMMTGGLNTFGPGGYFDTPLEPVLPIVMGRFERQEFGPDIEVRKDQHVDGPLNIVPSGNHFVTYLGNENLWRQLRPLKGANRLEVKPRATILAKSDQDLPMLVAWQYDAGRVLAFAGDSTYLWWSHGQQEAHRRFWRQAMLWLGNKDQLVRQDVWVRLSRRRFRPNETVEMFAGLRSETGDPLMDAAVTAELVAPDNSRTPIRLAPDGEEWRAELTDTASVGEYRIEIKARVDGAEVGETAARFQVLDRDLELSDPAANPAQLERMARVTRDAGGRTVAPEQLTTLIEEIEKRPPELEVEVESKWRFGDTALDAWPFFMVFVAMLGCEWWLRKRWGMM